MQRLDFVLRILCFVYRIQYTDLAQDVKGCLLSKRRRVFGSHYCRCPRVRHTVSDVAYPGPRWGARLATPPGSGESRARGWNAQAWLSCLYTRSRLAGL